MCDPHKIFIFIKLEDIYRQYLLKIKKLLMVMKVKIFIFRTFCSYSTLLFLVPLLPYFSKYSPMTTAAVSRMTLLLIPAGHCCCVPLCWLQFYRNFIPVLQKSLSWFVKAAFSRKNKLMSWK